MSDTNIELLIDVGLTIVDWRNQAGLSQEQLAEMADIHRTYLSEVEGGKRNPTLSIVNNIVLAQGKSLLDLFTAIETRKNGKV